MGVLFEELTALEALQAAGIPTSMYVGKSWASVVELLKSAGYAKLSNGLWASGELLTGVASTSAGTALATTTNVGAIEVLTGDAVLAADGSVAAYLGGTGAAAATVGETTAAAGAITLTPKTAIIIGVAAACGLALAYDTGQWIGSKYFDGADFDWSKDSIGGKVITLLKGDGKTYIDEDLANRIKDRLIEIGAFDKSFEPEQLVKGKKVNFIHNLYYNTNDLFLVGVLNVNTAITLCCQKIIENYNLASDFFTRTLTYLRISKERKRVYIQVITFFIKDGESIKYLYDYDMYVSSVTNDNDLIAFNNILSSNLGNSSNPTKDISVYIDRSSVADKDISVAYSEFYTDDNGSNWYEVLTTLGTIYREYIELSYSKSKSQHFYFPLGTLDGMKGVSKQPNATYPSSNPLSQTYPSWTNSGDKIFAGDDNDVNKKINMIPISIPANGESSKPQSDAQTGTNTDESIKEQIDSQEDVSQETNIDPSTKIPTDDTGDLPITPVPAVGIPGTGFVAIYNPTQSQLASFSQYLWSNDFIDNIKKLFEDPMQAIIGLHMIYATPSRGADHNIICGYLDSGVNSRTVSNQYINIACGAIKVNKYFGNILDYAPYTKIQLFLPFIGVVNLDTNEVMGSTLNVTYRVDVLTGACLAQVSVSRSDYGAVMYTFSGNCAVQLPITGGNYSSIIANTIGIGASIGATIASGGALAPVAVAGAAAGVSNSHLNVAHSGSIGANAGAMGGKIPYLIITRPKPYNANNYNNFYGYPSNNTIKLSSCTGYTRVKDIHLENISSATDDELTEIESLLKEGVII